MNLGIEYMLKDLKETHKRLSVDDIFITYIIFSTIGGILAIANIIIFVLMTFALYSYWYLIAYRACKKNRKDKKELLFNPPA